MKQLLLIITLSFSFTALSQLEYFEDSVEIRKFFPQKYGHKKWKFLFGIDANRSFYAGKPVKFNGFRFGAQYKGVHRFGLGVYGLNKNVEFTDVALPFENSPLTTTVKFNVKYTDLFYERVFYKTPRWEFSIPTYLAGGTVEGIYQDTAGVFQHFIDKPFSAIGLSAQAKVYFWKWLIPHVSIGYRLIFNSEQEVKRAFNSPYFSFGVSIGILDLYRRIFKHDEVRKVINTKIEEGAVN